MSSIIFEARDISYQYPRGMEAIRGISFHVRKGEKIALVGPNGAGKSTLLLMFNGMLRPDSGIILFDNEPIQYDKASLRILRNAWGLSFRTRTGRLYCTNGLPGRCFRADKSWVL